MHIVRFGVLGPLQATRDGRELLPSAPKHRIVLAALLLARGRPVRTDTLIEALWRDTPPPTAVKTVQKYVFMVRRALGDPGLIVSHGDGYEIRPAALDVQRFERLATESEAASTPELAAARMAEALALWRGDPYAELGDLPAANAERRRLEECRMTVLESLVGLRLELGQHATLIAQLERLVHEHPLRERLWEQLMTALYRSGRQGDALTAYHRLRAVLIEQLGVEPAPSVRRLYQRILDHDSSLSPAHGLARGNLPRRLTSFVGRTAELAELPELLARHRLVTLTGPGGSGKTRLAVELGDRIRARDGVWLVELEGVTAPGRVPGAVADALRLGEQHGRPMADVVADHLAERHALVLMDNCEHLSDAVARLVDRLLRAAPGLRVLATSRQPLGVEGELVLAVGPLPLPGDPADVGTCDAGRLLIERARSADPRFAVTGANAAGLAQICRRLDGMPLALELAAARLRAFDPAHLAGLLDDRFKVLISPLRTAPARHQTLRAAIAWSYDLLSPEERRLFRHLSIFEGGFTLEAAEQVHDRGDALALLPALIDKSLLVADRGLYGGSRYRMLETLRAYGRAQLTADEAHEAHRRHAACFTQFALRADRELHGTGGEPWVRRVDEDRDNLRAALTWSLDNGQIDQGLRLVGALGGYWSYRDLAREGQSWVRVALAAGERATPGPLAEALVADALLAVDQSEHEEGARLARRALELFGTLEDEVGAARAVLILGLASLYRGDYAQARPLLHRCLDDFTRLGLLGEQAQVLRRLGHLMRLQGAYGEARAYIGQARDLLNEAADTIGVAQTMWDLGVVRRYEGDYPAAARLCRESLAVFDQIGDASGVAHVRYTLGDIARIQGDAALARRLYEQSLATLHDQGDLRCVASTQHSLAALALAGSALAEAAELLTRSLRIRHRIGDRTGVAECLEGFAALSESAGEPLRAVRLLAAAQRIRVVTGATRPASDAATFAARTAALPALVGEAGFDEAWHAGYDPPEDQLVAELLTA
ncbi:tetratricopeptide repeat protein [Streptosporangiaceae bacterium NEAU-GS5]|nr:tetratricopeptide repeat protein [Streptosporangiaceae bacterium NEAU-GS5]